MNGKNGRPLPIVAFLGLAALGATCKGSDARPNDPAPANATASEVLVRAPAVTELKGVALYDVPPAQRADAVRILNETFCYCGCPRTVAACLANREACSCVKCSDRMANFVTRMYKAGASTEDVEEQLLRGFSEGYNQRPADFSQADQPSKGPNDAKVELVEFADFRCPHCADTFEVLLRLMKEDPSLRVRYYYFPLSGFGEASIRAAEAAEEARQQGKFWPMARLLYRRQHAFEKADLANYAKQVGLDMARFTRAMDERIHRDKVMDDKRIGESVGVISTPSVFVNGRPFGLARSLDNFKLRVVMERERGTCL